MSSSERNNAVTIAKAIAIILMVMGHSKCPVIINNMLDLIRMPLFFIMSGYCFKDKYLANSVSYLKKRIKGIYLPYIKWSLFFLFIHNTLYTLNIYNNLFCIEGYTDHIYYLQEIAKKTIGIVIFMKSHDILLGGYWFLNSLLWGSLIFYFAKRMGGGKPTLCIGVLLLISILISSTKMIPEYLPLSSRNFIAASFIYMGNFLNNKAFTLYKYKHTGFIIIPFVLLFLLSLFWHSAITTLTTLEIIPYFIVATIGSLSLFSLSHTINDNNIIGRFLTKTGGITFNILTWHMLSFKVVSYILILYYGLDIRRLAEFPVIIEYAQKGWWVLYLIAGVFIPYTWYFINKWIHSKLT